MFLALLNRTFQLSPQENTYTIALISIHYFYSVLVSVSCPKALYHLESDNIFHITVVVADWLG